MCNGTLLKAGIFRLQEEGQDTKEASVMGQNGWNSLPQCNRDGVLKIIVALSEHLGINQ